MPSTIQLSVVIPLYNEEATLIPLFEQIQSVVEAQTLGAFEVIFIDDGSTDDSWQKLSKLKAAHPNTVSALRFRRNQGKAAAL